MQNDKLTKLGSNKTEYIDIYNPDLLEAIEREPRRVGYIAPMNGYDIWTAFEFSYLKPNGLPDFCVLRIYNPASSKYIFESKSLKLYLNSFNNTRFENRLAAMAEVKETLSRFVGSEVTVMEVSYFKNEHPYHYNSTCLESVFCDPTDIYIDKYEYDKSLLKLNMSSTLTNFIFHSNLLRSNCEKTKQPDYARVLIRYEKKEKTIDMRSLLKYIVSYRKHQEFHEPTCERIYNDLFEILEPKVLTVICQYTRRGGIDINIVRSTDARVNDPLNTILNLPKLIQQ
jgi:7-cyano-7-deazaguanine reductase